MNSRKAERLHDFLERQRWFAGKGRDFTIDQIHPLSWLAEPDPALAVRIELITVRYADDNSTETYQLPLAYRTGPVDNLSHATIGSYASEELGGQVMMYDALHDKEATTLWLAALLDEREWPDLRFHRIGTPDIARDEHSIVLTVEQSNTSLAFGEATLLKVFRRVQHGVNPDIEIHDALTRGGAGNIARLYGSYEAQWPDASGTVRRGDLGMFSDFFRTASNGWELAITSVRDLYAEGDLHADEVGGDFAGESQRLGATTAEVHTDLARLLGVDTWGPEQLRELTEGMHVRLSDAAKAVPELDPYVEPLRAAFDELAECTEPIPVQRIHGDFHLGQTMRTVGGWRLIDFEGEPVKDLTARQGMDSPLRDVAGMLRSFDYAAQNLLMRHDHPDEQQLVYRAEEWAERNRAAFCRGYAEIAGTDPRKHDVLLRAYETDKAIYEVVYESRTRPTWINIPLSAIKRLAAMS